MQLESAPLFATSVVLLHIVPMEAFACVAKRRGVKRSGKRRRQRQSLALGWTRRVVHEGCALELESRGCSADNGESHGVRCLWRGWEAARGACVLGPQDEGRGDTRGKRRGRKGALLRGAHKEQDALRDRFAGVVQRLDLQGQEA